MGSLRLAASAAAVALAAAVATWPAAAAAGTQSQAQPTATAAQAGANATQAQAQAILRQCATGQLTRSYPAAALQAALREMPASQRQYSPCVDVIEAALAGAGHSGGGGTGGSGGSFLPTPVLVLVVLGGVTAGAVAVRRRQSAGPGGPRGDQPSGGAS